MDTWERFYLVWCPGSGSPTKRHPFLGSAIEEAQRLCRLEGKPFYVLQSVGCMGPAMPMWSKST